MPKRVLDVGNCAMDHGAVRALIERSFSAQVEQSHDLQTTLETMRTAPFDLVLVNRKLDRDFSDGLAVIQAIKSDPQLKDVPVMMITNYADHQRLAEEAGAELGFGKSHLNEPATIDRLRVFLD